MKEQLPAQVLAELFSNSLVYTGEKFRADIYEKTEHTEAKQEPAIIKKEQAAAKEEPVAMKPVVINVKQAPVEEKVTKPGKWYLGNYEKKFVVLVSDENNVHLGDAELELLTGILSACKMNLAHIALINFKNHVVTFAQLKKDLQPQFIVAFGINALQVELPFSMPDYQVQQYDNCAILTAPSLIQLNEIVPAAKAEKSKLWNSLKKMLNL